MSVPPRLPVTGVVLAGGASSRMGANKAFLELDGRPLIEVVIGLVGEVCAEVLVVARDASPYGHLGVTVVEDQFPGVGVLGGLHAGLMAAAHDLILAVGCDMPFLSPDLLRAFVAWADGFDVVILRRGEWVDPLHAVYRQTCLAPMEAAVRSGQRRIVSFFPQVRVRSLTVEDVSALDPDLRSFRNINTPREWSAARREWREHHPGRRGQR